MLYRSAAALLALVPGLTQVAGQICAENIVTTHGGLTFYLYDDSIESNNYRPLQLRPSSDGAVSYVALDNSSPQLLANLDNGEMVSSEESGGVITPLSSLGFLYNYTTIPNISPPTTVGQLGFADPATNSNASDSGWYLMGASGFNTYNLWRNEPVNTLNGFQICEATFDLNEDGTPWYYFQYVDWVGYYPPECEFVAVLVNVTSSDMPTC